MKTRLEQLTMAEFVDVVCGDLSPLASKHEILKAGEAEKVARSLVLEYRGITEPGGENAICRKSSIKAKARISLIVFTICQNLVSAKRYKDAKSILVECGYKAEMWDDKRLKGFVSACYGKALREKGKEEEKEETGDGDTRKAFDALTAAMMAHFKFQLDMTTIKATIYAHLVARYDRDVKSQMEILKK